MVRTRCCISLAIDVPMHSFIGDTAAVAALAKTRTIPFYFDLFATPPPPPPLLSSEFSFNMQCDRIYVVPPKQYVCVCVCVRFFGLFFLLRLAFYFRLLHFSVHLYFIQRHAIASIFS